MTEKHQKRGAHASSQEEVVDTAFRMIDEQGYEKFSIRTLADELGIGTMSVYTYVPSKNQLLFLVLAKMREGIDNAPIPGESWEDSLHRICGSIRENSLSHPRVRLMQLQTQITWPAQHNRNTYLLHIDQGMTQESYDMMWTVLRAFLSGYIDREAGLACTAENKGDDPYGKGHWVEIRNQAIGEQRFHEGLDVIIRGLKDIFGPQCNTWRTPENPETWKWGKE